MGKLLKTIKIRQDFFSSEDKNIRLVSKSNSSNIIPICPMKYKYKEVGECKIQCLYCYFKDDDIDITGNLGYLESRVKE